MNRSIFETEFKRECVKRFLIREASVETARGRGCLDIVAARTKLGEGNLHDIVGLKTTVSDEVMNAVLHRIPSAEVFTDDDVLEYLQHFADNGQLEDIRQTIGASDTSVLHDAIHSRSMPAFLRILVVNSFA